MKILVINSGSSSIKYSLFEMKKQLVRAEGILSRVGEEQSILKHRYRKNEEPFQEIQKTVHVDRHREGLALIGQILRETEVLADFAELDGIGHRVVHGGEDFSDPQVITKEVLASIRENSSLAPLHNPPNLMGIEVTLECLPDIPQVAVFDTAFHQSLPPEAYNYALPYELYTKYRIRRYGFHGTSHSYVATRAAAFLERPLEELRIITLHLGNGASACAIRNGKSIDTSMGMTPLEGLIMGTRCGDIGPGVIFHLGDQAGYSTSDLDKLLNKESGLKGICGANNMRDIINLVEKGDAQAKLAVKMTCYRIKKYIGAYFAALNGLDVLVFTAGIGENSPVVRAGTCEDLSSLGIVINQRKNRSKERGAREIQAAKSKVKILIVPTDEELEIAEATVRCIAGMKKSG